MAGLGKTISHSLKWEQPGFGAGGSFTTIPDSLTIVANYACEESQTRCTLANCRAQDLFPIGPETFLESADSAHCKAEGSSTFPTGLGINLPCLSFRRWISTRT
jgi:hypothetical protein